MSDTLTTTCRTVQTSFDCELLSMLGYKCRYCNADDAMWDQVNTVFCYDGCYVRRDVTLILHMHTCCDRCAVTCGGKMIVDWITQPM